MTYQRNDKCRSRQGPRAQPKLCARCHRGGVPSARRTTQTRKMASCPKTTAVPSEEIPTATLTSTCASSSARISASNVFSGCTSWSKRAWPAGPRLPTRPRTGLRCTPSPAATSSEAFAADSGGQVKTAATSSATTASKPATRLPSAWHDAVQRVRHGLEPQLGSPALGPELAIEGPRCWRLDGFPLPVWYFECAEITCWSCAGSHSARKRATGAASEGDVFLTRGRLWVAPRACRIACESGYSAWF